MNRNITKLKTHRLDQLGDVKLTAQQKLRIARLCKCTTNHVETVLSNQYDAINYKILYFAAVETENKAYVKKYVRPIFYEQQNKNNHNAKNLRCVHTQANKKDRITIKSRTATKP